MRTLPAVPSRIAALVLCAVAGAQAQNQAAAPAKPAANPPPEFVG
jgi:hypothetical protein